MYKTSTFRLHLIVFLWGFTAILGKLIHANAEVLVFYRMLFAAGFLYVFIRFIKKDSIKIASQLCYSNKVIFRIQNAKTIEEVYRIMLMARRGEI